MKCEDIKNNLQAYMDKEIDPSQKAEIEKHMSDCALCKRKYEFLLKTAQAFKRSSKKQPSAILAETVLNKTKEEIQ